MDLKQTEAAAALNLSTRHVQRLGKLGLPRNEDGTYPFPACAEWYEDWRDEQASRNGSGADPDLLTASRARKEAALASLHELTLAERREDLVSVPEQAKLWDELARRTREGCMALPDRLADQLAAEDDPFEVHRLLSTELRKALTALADAIASEGEAA